MTDVYKMHFANAAALTQHDRRLKMLGAEYITGGGNDFYKRIGYKDEIHWLHWKKTLR